MRNILSEEELDRIAGGKNYGLREFSADTWPDA